MRATLVKPLTTYCVFLRGRFSMPGRRGSVGILVDRVARLHSGDKLLAVWFSGFFRRRHGGRAFGRYLCRPVTAGLRGGRSNRLAPPPRLDRVKGNFRFLTLGIVLVMVGEWLGIATPFQREFRVVASGAFHCSGDRVGLLIPKLPRS